MIKSNIEYVFRLRIRIFLTDIRRYLVRIHPHLQTTVRFFFEMNQLILPIQV